MADNAPTDPKAERTLKPETAEKEAENAQTNPKEERTLKPGNAEKEIEAVKLHPDWTRLPSDMYELIATKLQDKLSRWNLRETCRTIRKAFPPIDFKPVSYKTSKFTLVEYAVFVVENAAINEAKVIKLRSISHQFLKKFDEDGLCNPDVNLPSQYGVRQVNLFNGKKVYGQTFDGPVLNLGHPDLTITHLFSHWDMEIESESDSPLCCPAIVVKGENGTGVKAIMFEDDRSLVLLFNSIKFVCVEKTLGTGNRFISLVLYGGKIYAQEKDSSTCFVIDPSILFAAKEVVIDPSSIFAAKEVHYDIIRPKMVEKIEMEMDPIPNVAAAEYQLAVGIGALYGIRRVGDTFSLFEFQDGMFHHTLFLDGHFLIYGKKVSCVVSTVKVPRSLDNSILYHKCDIRGFGFEVNTFCWVNSIADNAPGREVLNVNMFIRAFNVLGRNQTGKGFQRWTKFCLPAGPRRVIPRIP